jgi:hypothetical protein
LNREFRQKKEFTIRYEKITGTQVRSAPGLNLLQIRLDGPYSAAFLGKRTAIALQNQQNLSSPSRIFASVS